jgi:hypothetical protein
MLHRPDATPPPIGSLERGLEQVLGLVRVTAHQVRRAEQRRRPLLDELFERALAVCVHPTSPALPDAGTTT